MNQNLNSLVNRMFAKQESTNDSTTTTTNQQAQTTNIKRNLFGIRLNHDQLKQDLKDMWQEQLDRKKREWNFDFETLKPVVSESDSQQQPRYEWNKVKTQQQQQILNQSDDMMLTTFNDYESSDEEDDEALAVPAFYKYQRRQKMSQFKIIQIESNKPTAFSKLKQAKTTKVHKPKAVKSQLKTTEPTTRQQNLIITFSENRKDTLRSANSTQKVSSNKSGSAFKQPATEQATQMKQTTLLDMLKQRKRKTSNVSGCVSASKATTSDMSQNFLGAANSIVHNLRPRTISFN